MYTNMLSPGLRLRYVPVKVTIITLEHRSSESGIKGARTDDLSMCRSHVRTWLDSPTTVTYTDSDTAAPDGEGMMGLSRQLMGHVETIRWWEF